MKQMVASNAQAEKTITLSELSGGFFRNKEGQMKRFFYLPCSMRFWIPACAGMTEYKSS